MIAPDPRSYLSAPGVAKFGVTQAGGIYYGQLVDRLKALTEAVVTTSAPDAVVVDAARSLSRVTDQLEPHRQRGGLIPAGHRWDLPGRGHPLLIPFRIERLTETFMRGRVRFGVVHMGHPGVVHGGFLPLVFDEALGVFPSQLDPPARTVSMKVDYRTGTPIDTDLVLECHLRGRAGRKVQTSGTLSCDGMTVAVAEGTYVQPVDSD